MYVEQCIPVCIQYNSPCTHTSPFVFLVLKPMPKSINIMVTLGMHTLTAIDKLHVYFVYFKLEKRDREIERERKRERQSNSKNSNNITIQAADSLALIYTNKYGPAKYATILNNNTVALNVVIVNGLLYSEKGKERSMCLFVNVCERDINTKGNKHSCIFYVFIYLLLLCT